MQFLMKCLKLFSERQKELRGEVPDVYQYDTIPRQLRVSGYPSVGGCSRKTGT